MPNQTHGVAANVLASLALVKADRLFDTLDCSTAGLSLERVGSVLLRLLESLLVLRVELEPVVMSFSVMLAISAARNTTPVLA